MPDTFPAAASWRRRVLCIVLTLTLAALGVSAAGPPAHAAGYGPGYDDGLGHLGAFSIGGVNVYCLDIEAARPVGATGGPNYSTGWAGLSATNLARLNWAISTYGQSADRRWTAAVHLYVWSIADAVSYNSHGMSGDSWFIARATSGDQATILANLATIRAGAAAISAAPVPGSGTAVLNITMFDTYNGTVEVTITPAVASGTIALTGAVYNGPDTPGVASPGDTSITVLAGTGNGSRTVSFPIRGLPLDSETESYAIEANATFQYSTGGGYLGRIAVYFTGSAQPLAGPGGQPPTTVTFSANDYNTDPLDVQFEPVISTQVTDGIVQPGDALVDQVTASLAPTSPASEWRQWETGDYMEILARGTLYGPFANPPIGPGVPADAPIAWTEEVTLVGPGPYATAGGFAASLSGYYTWVWSVDYADQSPFVQPYLTDGYSWVDAFGQATETVVTAVAIDATSQVAEGALGLRQPVADTLTVTHDDATGSWWTTDGVNPIAARFVGIAYWYPGDIPPLLSASAPPEAVILETLEFTSIARPGDYTTSPVVAPQYQNGYIVWQWELVDDGTGNFVAWRDDWGLPSETTRVTVPSLVTSAVQLVPATGAATDTATISGEPTGEPTWLSFAVYGPVDAHAPVCDATTLVDQGPASLIEVTTPGLYSSAPVKLDELGTYAWVASLWTEEGDLITQGVCGDPAEMTDVVPFVVATAALEVISTGEEAHDRATVSGPTPPGATISFAAYHQAEDGADPVCEETNRVFVIDSSIPLDGPGVYVSPDIKLERAGTYLWVETVRSRFGVVLHEGECGALYELTNVQVPTLAFTGAQGVGLSSVGSLAAILTGGIMLMIRRRQCAEKGNP